MAGYLTNQERGNQGAAFLTYLQNKGILTVDVTSTKENLRQTYYEQFKSIWKSQHDGPVVNFSSTMFRLKNKGKIRIQKNGKVSLKIKRETSSGQGQNYLSGIAVNQHFSSKRDAPEGTPIPHGEAELQECVETNNWGYRCKTCNVIAKSWKDIKAHIGGKKHWVQKLLYGLKKYR